MTHFENLNAGSGSDNLTTEQLPHRDRIVGLEEKKQPKHIHTDAKSYLDRHEQVPSGLINKEEERENTEEISGQKRESLRPHSQNIEEEFPHASNKELPVTNKNILNQNESHESKNFLEKAKDTVVEGVKNIGDTIKHAFS